MVMPGDNVSVEVELITPIAMEKPSGSRFAKAAKPSAPVAWPKFWTNVMSSEVETSRGIPRDSSTALCFAQNDKTY